MSKKITFSALALTSVLLGACSNTPEQGAQTAAEQKMKTMQVQVLYKDRSMLPPGSQLTVTLSDVSKMDVAAEVIASETVTLDGAPPYDLALTYAADAVKERMRYSVSAKITHNGELRYITTQNNDPFGTTQTQSPIKVMMERVAKPNENLVNTYWKAMKIGTEQVVVQQREPQITLHQDGRVSGFLGCNQVMGQYVTAQHFGLRFKSLASTRKMCMEQMDQEQAFSKVLADTFSYRINGDTLTLKNEQGDALASFKAVHLP
ncbi:META domain-containing protein [Pseudoalteromonas sp. T1lg22]|uniref:META domain-containing protein n=1 Tax=Pseudoalteromonas sp. T1lg22 TaxID=2077096 RepID=UPI000CF64F84|nr:META domain-containing protein [Pseudoalteromonas sp. T1lg22]